MKAETGGKEGRRRRKGLTGMDVTIAYLGQVHYQNSPLKTFQFSDRVKEILQQSIYNKKNWNKEYPIFKLNYFLNRSLLRVQREDLGGFFFFFKLSFDPVTSEMDCLCITFLKHWLSTNNYSLLKGRLLENLLNLC